MKKLIFDSELMFSPNQDNNLAMISAFEPDEKCWWIGLPDNIREETKQQLIYGSLLPEAVNSDPRSKQWKFRLIPFSGGDISNIAPVFQESSAIGFNSLTEGSDDEMMCKRGLKIRTAYDILQEIRLALGMIPIYNEALKHHLKAGYSLDSVSRANFGLGKCELTYPDCSVRQNWIKGAQASVIRYALRDVYLTLRLFESRENLIDPRTGRRFKLRSIEEAIKCSAEFAWFSRRFWQ
ncbi:MAG TPA: hypothetical protein V6D21_04495 [Candidatus Obscuribacterales bacterium]